MKDPDQNAPLGAADLGMHYLFSVQTIRNFHGSIYRRTSVARILMAGLPRLFGIRS